ncbi:14290_t:CDS:2 [Gigaspora rosea]|nr:14290_t:CDS:2 [Gigaspora rosea]
MREKDQKMHLKRNHRKEREIDTYPNGKIKDIRFLEFVEKEKNGTKYEIIGDNKNMNANPRPFACALSKSPRITLQPLL